MSRKRSKIPGLVGSVNVAIAVWWYWKCFWAE